MTILKRTPGPNYLAKPLSTGNIFFHADGELELNAETWVPVALDLLSTKEPFPDLVELTASSTLGEFALRDARANQTVKLNVRGRQFRARLVGQLENSPLQCILASVVFAALFPATSPKKVVI
jgi:hypothetical protein